MAFCDGVMQSNLIIGNSADTQAGGLARCDGEILNNTIYGNAAGLNGGGIYDCRGTIGNSIFWANTAGGSGMQIHLSNPSFCCIQDWTAGGNGNTDQDPRFVGPDEDDFHLSAESPCIDNGDNSVLSSPGVDMDGDLRVAFGGHSLTVDMGAYERNSTRLVIKELAFLEDSRLMLTWSSQPVGKYLLWACDDVLTGAWVSVAKPVSSQGTTTSFTISAPNVRRKFYQVRMAGR